MEPVTREERLMDGQNLDPITREERILAGEDLEVVTRREWFLKKYRGGGGGDITVESLNVTENGTYTAPTGKAYTPVKVELPLSSKTITENGTYTASDDNLAGYDEVTVAVEGYAKKSIANTPTPIATFNASALPMPSLKVSIEAVQDLHGYDNPWPAGGGKNKLNPDYRVESGASTINYYLSNTQLSLSANTYCASVSEACTISVFSYTGGQATEIKKVYNSTSTSFTLESTSDIGVQFYKNGGFTNITNVKCQIEVGSTATSYAPYSNICPISGFSAVNRYRTGKNLFDESILLECSGWTVSNGVYSGDSAQVNAKYGNGVPNLAFKPNTQYTFSFTYGQDGSAGIGLAITISYTDNTVTRKYYTLDTIGFVSVTSTAGKSIKRLELSYGANRTIHLSNMQLEEGDTATTYEAFSGTTYTTTLKDSQGNPLTCYGGELSNVNGVQTLEPYKAMRLVSECTWYGSNGVFYTDSVISSIKHGDGRFDHVTSSTYKTQNIGASSSLDDGGISVDANGYIQLKDTRYSSAIDFKTNMGTTQLVYELATPQTIPQDNLAIASDEGTNNIWADSGDIQSGEYMEAL